MIPNDTSKRINDGKSDAAAILAAGAALAFTPTIQTLEGKPFIVLPNSAGEQKVNDLTHLLPAPTRLTQQVNVRTAAALISYLGLFGDKAKTVLFANRDALNVQAAIDYHATADKASWIGHRVSLALQQTDAWKEWTELDGEQQTQTDFAQFLEDHVPDIAEPDGAVLVQMARNFEATKDVSFKSVQRVNDGSVTFNYEEDVKGSTQAGSLARIPTEFKVGLVPFHGAKKYAVTARLRYRVSGGGLTIWFDLLRLEDVIETAFADIVGQIENGTKDTARAVILGSI